MSVFISLLRGINVSGQNPIRMADLSNLYRSLGYEDVVTYLQSGNVVFNAGRLDGEKIAARIEAQIRQTFSYSVAVFVRDVDYIREIVANNPFIAKGVDISKLYTTFLYRTPTAAMLNNLDPPSGATDEFSLGKDAIYLYCPNGYGRTKLSNTFFEKKLDVPATTRNWNTVRALLNIAKEQKYNLT
jgi:uncharacterized protein (DUF1697 family)